MKAFFSTLFSASLLFVIGYGLGKGFGSRFIILLLGWIISYFFNVFVANLIEDGSAGIILGALWICGSAGMFGFGLAAYLMFVKVSIIGGALLPMAGLITLSTYFMIGEGIGDGSFLMSFGYPLMYAASGFFVSMLISFMGIFGSKEYNLATGLAVHNFFALGCLVVPALIMVVFTIRNGSMFD